MNLLVPPLVRPSQTPNSFWLAQQQRDPTMQSHWSYSQRTNNKDTIDPGCPLKWLDSQPLHVPFVSLRGLDKKQPSEQNFVDHKSVPWSVTLNLRETNFHLQSPLITYVID